MGDNAKIKLDADGLSPETITDSPHMQILVS
jgi:hypothetical protein